MNSQYIQFVQTDLVHSTSYLTDQFQLRTDKKHVWLQKACIWILKKLEAYAVKTDVIIKRNTIDTKNLFELVLKQQYELYGRYLLTAERVLMGYDEYSKFMEGEITRDFTFTAPEHYYRDYRRKEDGSMELVPVKVMGLRCTLIPWMKGILVLPKELE